MRRRVAIVSSFSLACQMKGFNLSGLGERKKRRLRQKKYTYYTATLNTSDDVINQSRKIPFEAWICTTENQMLIWPEHAALAWGPFARCFAPSSRWRKTKTQKDEKKVFNNFCCHLTAKSTAIAIANLSSHRTGGAVIIPPSHC